MMYVTAQDDRVYAVSRHLDFTERILGTPRHEKTRTYDIKRRIEVEGTQEGRGQKGREVEV